MLRDLYEPRHSEPDHTSIEEGDSEVPESHDESKFQFPEEVFSSLPKILKEVCDSFMDRIDKDVSLVGSLGVLSGCLPNVFGKYDRKKLGTNLFFLIIAPASAGKGALTWAKFLGMEIHSLKREHSKAKKAEYEAELKNLNKNKSSSGELPEPPRQEMHFIPSNTSSSGLLSALESNMGHGIFFSTEADTLSGALKQDWGNFSDIIRNAFHHDQVSLLRKTNNQFLEIDRPCLSIVLSGTPNQVRRLIPNTEDGLFSRFGYYSFDLEVKMKRVFDDAEYDFETHFRKLGELVNRFYEDLKSHPSEVEFKYTADQQSEFYNIYQQRHQDFLLLLGRESISSIRRLAVIHFRIAMILSILRFMGKTIPDTIECTDEDFRTATLIAEVLQNHAIKIFRTMPDGDKSSNLTEHQLKLFKALPDEFTRIEAVELAGKLDISASSVDRLLKGDLFSKLGYGKYRKANHDTAK